MQRKSGPLEEYFFVFETLFCLHRCNIVLQITMLITMTIIIANRLRFLFLFFLQ